MTQPTVSMQLKDLASAVGCRLTSGSTTASTLRRRGGPASDGPGDERRVGDIRPAHRRNEGLTRGRLTVAIVSTAKYMVPRILGRFCARHSDIDIALEVLNRDGVIARMRENRDELYIIDPTRRHRARRHPFPPNPLVAIAAASHPLAGRKRLPLARLAPERLILREPGSGTRLACDAHFTPGLCARRAA